MLEQTIKLINGIHYVLKAIEGKIAYICIKENYHDYPGWDFIEETLIESVL